MQAFSWIFDSATTIRERNPSWKPGQQTSYLNRYIAGNFTPRLLLTREMDLSTGISSSVDFDVQATNHMPDLVCLRTDQYDYFTCDAKPALAATTAPLHVSIFSLSSFTSLTHFPHTFITTSHSDATCRIGL